MSIASLHDVGFGPGLARHLLNHDPSSLLGFRCQPPLYCESSPIFVMPISPLWECGTTLVYFHRETKLFEKCSLQDINDVRFRHKSAQAVLADLFIELYEDELKDDELRVAAEITGFKHVERFLVEVRVNHGGGYEQWGTYECWREQFCAAYEG